MKSYDGRHLVGIKPCRLFVGNLSFAITDDALRELFSKHGAVSWARVVVDESGRSKGFGFVMMKSGIEADKAVKALNHRLLNCRALTVTPAVKTSSFGRVRMGW